MKASTRLWMLLEGFRWFKVYVHDNGHLVLHAISTLIRTLTIEQRDYFSFSLMFLDIKFTCFWHDGGLST